MSYIDTFDHEFVGFFGGLPVYHPLETIDSNLPNSADFNCDPTNLIIGGGDGEHPAFVLKRADCAVAHFVTDWLKRYAHTLPAPHDQQEAIWYTPWDKFLDTAIFVDSEAVFTFAGWDTRTYHNFYQRCCSDAMHTPYNEGHDGWFEWWVAACLGELILFSMPELVPTLEQILPKARTLIKPLLYTNILLPPPGAIVSYGRVRIDGQVVQGYSRWRQS